MASLPTFAGSSTRRPPPRRRLDRLRQAAAFALVLALPLAARALDPANLLAAERAFELSVEARDGGRVVARFAIADGYYLYRGKLRFALADGTLAAPPDLPPGKATDDPFFGQVDIYRGAVAVDVKFDRERAGETVRLVVESQGCADVGVCYPPQRQVVAVSLPQPGARPGPAVEAAPRKKSWFN
ncbi:MAG: protein-disulfide reductase DsbD N-terminal domain-containing protein [Betaproteobacteria bacterium]|nr:protein-disulfide reductase DsbD N-terminal domain-containing protein [Betaproteobacteria bacterium]